MRKVFWNLIFTKSWLWDYVLSSSMEDALIKIKTWGEINLVLRQILVDMKLFNGRKPLPFYANYVN